MLVGDVPVDLTIRSLGLLNLDALICLLSV